MSSDTLILRSAGATASTANQASASLQAFENVAQPAEIALLQPDAHGADDVVLEVGCDQPLSAQDSGRGRYHELRNAERPGDFARVQRARAPERQQTVVARIVAALDRNRADGAHHVGRHNFDDAQGGPFDGEAEALSNRLNRGARSPRIERHASADQPFRREPAEHEIGIRHRRLGAAFSVTGGARIGARAQRTDLKQVVAVEPGDRATAGAHRMDVDHRQPDGKPATARSKLRPNS